MLPLLVHTYKLAAWLSCMAQLHELSSYLQDTLITTQINYFSIVYSSGNSEIHSGTGMWFWSHSPACGDSHCRLPCLLAGDGPILPGSFWNR